MHNITISEKKKGRGFGEEHKGVFGKAWREKWKGEKLLYYNSKSNF